MGNDTFEHRKSSKNILSCPSHSQQVEVKSNRFTHFAAAEYSLLLANPVWLLVKFCSRVRDIAEQISLSTQVLRSVLVSHGQCAEDATRHF